MLFANWYGGISSVTSWHRGTSFWCRKRQPLEPDQVEVRLCFVAASVSFSFFLSFLIAVQLFYNVMLVSTVQRSQVEFPVLYSRFSEPVS